MLKKFERILEKTHNAVFSIEARTHYKETILGSQIMMKLLSDYTFDTVLDIGGGEGKHTEIFAEHGKTVTMIDYGESIYFEKKADNIHAVIADFNTYDFKKQFDCVWCSHCLEHQLNVQIFLEKVNAVLADGGVLAITVPPLKHEIVGGHVNLFNAGLLIYRLVLAGFDCSTASVLTYDYNIGVIVKKKKIDVLNSITYDCGDLKLLHQYFPKGLKYKENDFDTPFDGRIAKLNW